MRGAGIWLKNRSKYGNKKSGGYDSQAERNRAVYLNARLKAGEISDLQEQVRFRLIDGARDIITGEWEYQCDYICDFKYFDKQKEEWVIEDVKGYATPDYIIKRKLMKLKCKNTKNSTGEIDAYFYEIKAK